jgi:hypothetical protein
MTHAGAARFSESPGGVKVRCACWFDDHAWRPVQSTVFTGQRVFWQPNRSLPNRYGRVAIPHRLQCRAKESFCHGQ